MKGVLNLFGWLASGLVEGLCPGGALTETIAEELRRYNESATQIGEQMQKAWEESLRTLESALGGGGWIAPKSRKQFAEKFVKEVITPFAVQNKLTGGKLDAYLKKALEQCQQLIEMGDELIEFKVFDEKVLLDALSQTEGLSSEDMGIFLIDRIQTRLPKAKELLELLWSRNILLEGLVAHFNFQLSRNSSLADMVGRMDHQRIQKDLKEIKEKVQESVKQNNLSELAKLGARASQLATADELYRIQQDYHDLFGSLFEKIDKLSDDHEEIKDKLDQVMEMLAQLQQIQGDSRIRPEIGVHQPSVHEIKLVGKLHTLVKNIGWNMVPGPKQAIAANSMAVSLYGSQKIWQAIAVLEEAIKSNVQTPQTYFNYFQVLQAAGKNKEAVEAYNKSVKMDPGLALFPPDKYTMMSIIGRGGMGVVYKAHWVEKDIPVAIKVLLLPEEWYPGARNRFMQAAQTSATLHHPNIVFVYNVAGCDSQCPCMVMEYLEGIDLQRKVREQGTFNLAQGLQVAYEIAKGIEYAHSRGVVHRDLKPGNVVLTAKGIKIIDFGLAKREKDSTLTLAGEVFYTLYYSSPEQRSDFHKADHRSDIYSFGKTVYYLFTGEEPYDIDWEELPKEVRPIVQKATRKRPENRYKDMQEVLIAIEKAMQGESQELNGEFYESEEYESVPFIEVIGSQAQKPPQEVIENLPEEYVLKEEGEIFCGHDQSSMVYVPEGSFLMGDDSDRSDYDEGPVHEVYLSPYLIDVYPVNNRRYGMFLEELGQHREHPSPWCHPDEPRNKVHIPQFWYNGAWNQDDYPVVGVDWWDAYAYAKWAGKDLPSEAEWEKAARGSDRRMYPWGNELPTPDRCNYGKRHKITTPVTKFPNDRSPYGCSNMAGNVWEWCYDWFDPTYYKYSPSKDPIGPANGRCRVGRGGSWINDPHRIRTTIRAFGAGPGDRNHHLGFRTVRRLKK